MTNAEHHERICTILSTLVDVLDCDELADLASACGVKISDFYDSETMPDFEHAAEMLAQYEAEKEAEEAQDSLPEHKQMSYRERMYDRAEYQMQVEKDDRWEERSAA